MPMETVLLLTFFLDDPVVKGHMGEVWVLAPVGKLLSVKLEELLELDETPFP